MKYLLIFVIVFSSCKKYDSSLKRIEEDFQLKLTDTAGIRMNGSSVFTVTLTNTERVKEGLKINFSSNKGTVLVNDIVYQHNVASTKIRVDQDTGLFIIKAVVKEGDVAKFDKSLTAEFRRANADSIGLELDKPVYSITSPILIRAYLFRRTGYVSKGAKLFFRALQVTPANDSVPVGRFEGLFNSGTDISGKFPDVKFYSEVPLVDTPRNIILQLKTLNDLGDTLRKNHVLRYR